MTGVVAAPRSSATPTAPVLEARNVVVRFGGVTALNDVSLGLEPSAVVGLIGPNGAGKTSLFDLLTGINRCVSGSVVWQGEDITNRSVTWRARHGLRRTFQRQQPFEWLTVEDNLLAALEWRGGGGGIAGDVLRLRGRHRYEAQRRKRARDVLELCGLSGLRQAPAAGLPVGTARLVELARAIVDDPLVLLLDEPTSGLEEPDVERLGTIIPRLVSETGCSVGLVEHDISFVMALCQRVVVLNRGSVLASGEPREVQENKLVAEAYLGP
jgi:branched-chain amino acid transport system ATP-binding protein